MPGKVADSSLLAAVAFGEPEAAEAAASIGDSDLYEPTLLRYELFSIARKKVSNHPEQRSGLLRGLRAILSLDMRWVEPNHQQVVELALESELSTYDVSYLYIARELALPLVTYDPWMRVAAGDLGVMAWPIRPIS